jgi:hypothetical protein
MFFVFAVFSLILLSGSIACAASKIVEPNANGAKTGGDYEMERDFEGGIHLVCDGISINKDGDIYISLTITTEDDAIIEISTSNAEVFDANNRRFVPSGSSWAWVGDTRNKREVMGGIPIRGLVYYDTPSDYELTEFYPRVSFTFNGKRLVFRNVPRIQ